MNKNRITQILFVLLLSFSCTKKTVSPPSAGTSEESADDIYYLDIQPDIVLNSVSGTSLHASFMFYVNLPVDTVCSDSLKQCSFPEFTFKLSATNYYKKISIAHPDANYLHTISLVPAVSSDSILSEGFLPCAKFLKIGDTIRQRSFKCNFARIVSQEAPFYCYCYLGEHYLAFKKTRGSRINFGWIKVERFGVNGIKVKEIAINKTNGKAIICGQTQ